jgi:hypothetical protein
LLSISEGKGMAKHLGRWTVSDVAGIGAVRIGPSPGAYLRSPISDGAPSHTHIWLDRKTPPARTRVHDQARPSGGLPRRRGRDQQRLVARIRQDGVSGDCTAEDNEGQPLLVTQGEAGDLEIFNPGEGEVEGDQTDPEIIPSAVPGGKSIDRLRRRMAPRQVNDRSQPPGRERDQLAAMQSYLDAIWTPK